MFKHKLGCQKPTFIFSSIILLLIIYSEDRVHLFTNKYFTLKIYIISFSYWMTTFILNDMYEF